MGGKYAEFQDDGTFIKASSQSPLQSTPFETGTFTFDGEILRLNASEDSVYCAGIDAVYEAELSEDGDFIAHTLFNDGCGPRAADFSRGITRVDN